MIHARGFTLVELLLSVSIIGLLVGLSAPVYSLFAARNDLDISAQSVADGLRRAQSYARAGRDDAQWSVQIQGENAVLYQGTTYASRNTGEDEVLSMDGVTASGLSNIQFAKVSGTPNMSGSITLTSNNETRVITINAQGMVNY